MDKTLHLSLFQTDTVWQDVDANRRLLDEWFAKTPPGTGLIVLPEMFLTGFSMDVSKIAQEMDGAAVQWLRSKASSVGATIIGSLTIHYNHLFYNRLLVAQPDGQLNWYDKRHLFRMGEEHLHFSPGNRLLIENVKGWNIMPLVCYDLRFPVWSRNVGNKYDVLIYIANWPESRSDAFLSLLKARAIENQSFVVAVNRVGTDGQGIKYAGGSLAIDPKGKFLTEPGNGEKIINCSLPFAELKDFREKFPAYLDADNFEIKIN